MATNWSPKDPNDILDYAIDWSSRLDGDTIASGEWIVPDGITMDSGSFGETTATIWLSGGTAMKAYSITCRVVTAAGRQMDHSVSLTVMSR